MKPVNVAKGLLNECVKRQADSVCSVQAPICHQWEKDDHWQIIQNKAKIYLCLFHEIQCNGLWKHRFERKDVKLTLHSHFSVTPHKHSMTWKKCSVGGQRDTQLLLWLGETTQHTAHCLSFPLFANVETHSFYSVRPGQTYCQQRQFSMCQGNFYVPATKKNRVHYVTFYINM